MSEIGESEAFFASLRRDFDTSSPLRWSFMLRSLPEEQIDSLMKQFYS